MIFQVIAVSEPLPPLLAKCPIFLPSFYAHLSAIPFLIPSPTYMFENLPDPDPEYFASNAVSVALKHLHPAIHSAVTVGCREEDRVVQVDAGGLIHIASLEGYQQSSSEKLWKRWASSFFLLPCLDVRCEMLNRSDTPSLQPGLWPSSGISRETTSSSHVSRPRPREAEWPFSRTRW
jgi:hypothetical protein